MISLRVACLLLALGVPVSAASAGPADYKLGPEDKLQIKVFDWRTGSGEVYQWQALNGEFIVGAGGRLSLPLLGDIEASDTTPSELAKTIAQRLQTKIGLAQRPDASVQVIKYRPFYIMGVVDKQGEYDYRPDLSVLQAVSIAGGLARLADGNGIGLERETLVGRGDIRALTVERTELLIRQSRLDAEIADAASIAMPADLLRRQSEPAIARAIHEEQALFDARRESLRSQTATLKQSQDLLASQISALGAKDVSLARQLTVTRQELDQISGLVSQGLAVLPRKLAIEENAAQYESSRLDIQVATFRAQQDIAKASRDITELRAKERNDALLEATLVRTRLGEIEQKLETARNLLYEAEVHAPQLSAAAGAARPTPTYSIVRKIDGRPTTLQVEDSDPVQPGDVIQVEFTEPDSLASKNGTVEAPSSAAKTSLSSTD